MFPKLEEWSAKVQPEATYQKLASPAACLVKIMLYDSLARVFSGSGWGRFGGGQVWWEWSSQHLHLTQQASRLLQQFATPLRDDSCMQKCELANCKDEQCWGMHSWERANSGEIGSTQVPLGGAGSNKERVHCQTRPLPPVIRGSCPGERFNFCWI